MKPLAELDAVRVRTLLDYDPETGIFTWRRDHSTMKAGDVAGTISGAGYRMIGFQGGLYYAHRLAFVYMTGACPAMVDHANRDKTDNRWSNLRPCNQSQNMANRVSRNPLGKGVQKLGNTYRATIYRKTETGERKRMFLGAFPTVELAQAAYRVAAVQEFGEFARFD